MSRNQNGLCWAEEATGQSRLDCLLEGSNSLSSTNPPQSSVLCRYGSTEHILPAISEDINLKWIMARQMNCMPSDIFCMDWMQSTHYCLCCWRNVGKAVPRYYCCVKDCTRDTSLLSPWVKHWCMWSHITWHTGCVVHGIVAPALVDSEVQPCSFSWSST